jgi:hypothetical protein
MEMLIGFPDLMDKELSGGANRDRIAAEEKSFRSVQHQVAHQAI